MFRAGLKADRGAGVVIDKRGVRSKYNTDDIKENHDQNNHFWDYKWGGALTTLPVCIRVGKHTIEVISIERYSDELSNLQMLQIGAGNDTWRNLNKAELCAVDGVGCDNHDFK